MMHRAVTPSEREGPQSPGQHRVAARGILVDPAERVLLVHLDLPWVGPIWLVPGGGVELGEGLMEGLRREIHEETGYELGVEEAVGPVWQRHIDVERASGWVATEEHYFFTRVQSFEPRPAALTPEEAIWLQGWRWWSAAELRETSERIAPPSLGDRLGTLLALVPNEPVELPPRVYPMRTEAVGKAKTKP